MHVVYTQLSSLGRTGGRNDNPFFLVCVFLEHLHFKSKRSCVLFRVSAFLRGGKNQTNKELKLPSFVRINKRRGKEPNNLFLCLLLLFKCGLWDFYFITDFQDLAMC